jgi:hypothetical protein
MIFLLNREEEKKRNSLGVREKKQQIYWKKRAKSTKL